MKKLLSIILTITMLTSMAAIAFADEADKTIAVGINAQFPPFEYYDENGELYGFDIDLMNYIGERIGYNIEYVEFPFDRLLPAVASGEVDCAISGITITKERDGVVDYTRPYLEANITYKNGEEAIEQYAVVFSENSINKARLIEASGDPFHSKYMLVNNAIKELTEDSTIDKLIEKYELGKANISELADYKFNVVKESESEEIADTNIPRYETWEEIGLTNPYPSDWAAKDVDFAKAIKIMEGRDYNYKAPITREEFSELIYNLVLAINKEISATHNNAVTDTTNSKMLVLNGLGIINGKSETALAPNDYLTREEAATIIIRMINKVMPMAATEIWFEYDDIAEISQWASDSVQTISNLGFMNGVGNNKFAPKETYTTEQAIVTLVRVYEAAKVAGVVKEDVNIGIIGGADGPTSIIVGENINVVEKEDYENFYVEATKNTIEVDDFYLDEAIKLITESGKLAANKDFIRLYTTSDDMTDKILTLGTVDFNKPTDIFYLSADREQIIANIKVLADAEGIDIEDLGDAWFEHLWRKLNFSTIASLINSSYGSENLAALTILVNNRGYIMPKDFKNNFALFAQYEGDYSAIVSFYEYGDGVISANMSFVKNGDKDNVFRRMYEITSAVGKDGIKITKVK